MTDIDRHGTGEVDQELPLEEAITWFLRIRSGGGRRAGLAALSKWLQADARHAEAYRAVCHTWNEIGSHAAAPDIVLARRDALEDAYRAARSQRRASLLTRRRWAAMIAFVSSALMAYQVWQIYRGDSYSTGLGERRALTLSDGSLVTLDSNSHIRVRYSNSQRLIVLEEGQARFDVASNHAWPFKVSAQGETVKAVGTQFNVDILGGTVWVTLLQGHVAVTRVDAGARSGQTIEINPGQQIIMAAKSAVQLRSNVDLTHAMAWQSGKMFFENEPLVSAIERVNRYARSPIRLDSVSSSLRVSGVFNVGDADAFAEAVTAYFPLRIDPSRTGEIHLIDR